MEDDSIVEDDFRDEDLDLDEVIRGLLGGSVADHETTSSRCMLSPPEEGYEQGKMMALDALKRSETFYLFCVLPEKDEDGKFVSQSLMNVRHSELTSVQFFGALEASLTEAMLQLVHAAIQEGLVESCDCEDCDDDCEGECGE